MKIAGRRCLVCDCEGTMALDGAALARGLGSSVEPVVHHQLCRRQLAQVQDAATAGVELLIGCTQEAALFEKSLANGPPVTFVNIRERAGWSAEGAQSGPKIAALLAEAALAIPAPQMLTLRSAGRCLVIGVGDAALDAARQLAPRLEVTLLLTTRDEILPPRVDQFPILTGMVMAAAGHLGAFTVEVAGLAAAVVSSREYLRFGPAQERGRLETDLIVDLGGGQPLFPAPAKRDGYLRCDPRDPVAVQRALYEATGLVGEFEKPHYVAYDAAHLRALALATHRLHPLPGPMPHRGDRARRRLCPDRPVRLRRLRRLRRRLPDRRCHLCGTVRLNTLLDRLRILLGTYLKAGGADPVLLVHEDRHGGGLIDAMARTGRGLPARVLPFAVTEIAQLGFEYFAAAIAYGAGSVLILAPPGKRDEIAGLETTLGHATAMLDGLGYGRTG